MSAQRPSPIVTASDGVAQINSLSDGMRSLGKSYSHGLHERLEKVDESAAKQVRKAVKSLPRAVTGQVADVIKNVVRQQPHLVEMDDRSADQLEIYVDRVAHDPRSAREASEALDKLARELARHPRLRGPVGSVLSQLERRRFLGAGVLASIAGFAVAAGQAGRSIHKYRKGDVDDLVLSAGPVKLELRELGQFVAKVKGIGFPWIPGTVSVTLSGQTHGGPAVTSAKAKIKVPLSVPTRKGNIKVAPYAYKQVGADKDWGVGVSVKSRFGVHPRYPSGWQGMPWMSIIR